MCFLFALRQADYESKPDVFSTFSAMRTNSGSLAIGELLGAAGFITSVVAGSMALVRPFRVARKSFIRDLGFFILAAGFSMIFLADGCLQLWECTVMITFYFLYVFMIALWQWSSSRRERFGGRQAHAREYFLVPESTGVSVDRQSEQSVTPASTRRSSFLDRVLDSERELEFTGESSDNYEDTRDRWLAGINTNMRLGRPGPGSSLAGNLIRPSLVGALEFRALLASLEKSRAQQSYPINLRRYSDDPRLTLAQQRRHAQDHRNSLNVPLHPDGSDDTRAIHSSHRYNNRRRAISAINLEESRLSARQTIPRTTEESGDPTRRNSDFLTPAKGNKIKHMEQKQIAALSSHSAMDTSHANLIPTSEDYHATLSPGSSLAQPPTLIEYDPWNETEGRPDVDVQPSSPTPLTPYYDDPNFDPQALRNSSVRLPPSPDCNDAASDFHLRDVGKQPRWWWPSTVLPTPEILVATLFPTIYSWRGKNFIQKLLAIITCPSVFLLTITLPVVEPTSVEEDSSSIKSAPEIVVHDSDRDNEPPRDPVPRSTNQRSTPEHYLNRTTDIESESFANSGGNLPAEVQSGGWNRWLVIVQIFMAPFFVVLIIWANLGETSSLRTLLLWTAYAMLGSLVTLFGVILATSEEHPPRYRSLLCFIGFIVSVAWISTIANEVVGILKAFGVILGISEAILGLTVFAVGNR